LRDAKSLLDDGIFSEKEFQEHKKTLKHQFRTPAPPAPVPAPLSVSQPGGPPTAPVATSDLLKGLIDSECRNPSTNRYLYDYRKCSKCPSNTCFSHISQFSQDQEKKEASIRLCFQHEGIQGHAGVSSTVQTPKPRSRRTFTPVIDMCSPPVRRSVVHAIDVSRDTVSVPDVRPGGSREPTGTDSMLLGETGYSLIDPIPFL
jgi:hypothetical protein